MDSLGNHTGWQGMWLDIVNPCKVESYMCILKNSDIVKYLFRNVYTTSSVIIERSCHYNSLFKLYLLVFYFYFMLFPHTFV